MRDGLKRGCGVGCLAVFTLTVILMGAATWYTRGINRDYKAVQQTEQDLLAAVGAGAYVPPTTGGPDSLSLAAFLAVRDSLAILRPDLEAAAAGFNTARDRQRGRGVRGMWTLLGSGTELAPVYAGYWAARNRALLTVGMGPAEYNWHYRLIYYRWLGHDPAEGRKRDQGRPSPPFAVLDTIPLAIALLLEPHRLRLEAGYSPALNPVELIFADEAAR